jgi:selenocysteine-specific elongation factor
MTRAPLTDHAQLQVVATAGHVDHGKSALVLRLTGMDPDRLAEEKRRGLTIDLGFAWTTLPSGREVGFVDVPGHERFIRNMLAGVGPVRLVLFVVAADEGWKPQSEEHLQIVDVLGIQDAVVVLSKRDLVDDEILARRVREVSERMAGTGLGHAPIVACSSATGHGLDELRTALDDMLERAPAPEQNARPRQFLDRVFTIRGSGTVVTGTLTGGPLAVGQEAQILPSGHRARIRGLQSHRRTLQVAHPASRVAVNLAGTAKEELERGDVLTLTGQWRPTSVIDAIVRPVRGLDHPITARGAYKLHVGSAERDARLRLYGERELTGGGEAFARITLRRPVVVDLGDSFVLREAGRRQTVAGGEVLDTEPPVRPGPEAVPRLRARIGADRGTMALLLVRDRGVVRASDVLMLTGVHPEQAVGRGAIPLGVWLATSELVEASARALTDALGRYHAEHPLRPGLEIPEARTVLAGGHRAFADPGLCDALLTQLVGRGVLARDGAVVRLPSHRASTVGRDDADRLVEAVASAEPTPPSVRELVAAGFGHELIRATCAEGRLVRVSPEIVVTPAYVATAETLVRELAGPPGITVSRFREALGTSRKYALPMLEYFDARGVTVRRGDVRMVRG